MKNDVHIFEVRDGGEVIGRYTKRTPAERRRKELRRSGRKVKLFSLFVRKYVPLPEKVLPRGVEFWKGRIPWEIPPEAAAELRNDIRGITDTFYIGSYRDGETAMPYDRTEDLSLQPNGDTLALCYHVIAEDRTYLILDRVDWVTVRPYCVEFSGIGEDGFGMMFTMEIAGKRNAPLPHPRPFRFGWYATEIGALFYIAEADIELTKEQHSERLAGMFPYVAVYPGFAKGDYSVGRGYVPLHDGEALEDFVRVRLGMELTEHIAVDNAAELAGAFMERDARQIRRIIGDRPGTAPFAAVVSGNRKRIRTGLRRMKR